MPSSFLSPLAAPAHTASSTAKASDLLARQSHGQGHDFGQALALSVSNAQHNTRREQAALEAKSTEARRVDANRAQANRTQADRAPQAEPSPSPKQAATERPHKQDKQDKQDKAHHAGKDQGEALQSPVPSSAALGVLDWLGGQVKAQAPGRGGDDTSTPVSDPLSAGKGHASVAPSAPVDDVQASHSPAAAHGAKSLGRAGSEDTGLGAAQQAPTINTEATQDKGAPAKPGDPTASVTGSAALLKADAQAAFHREGSQSLVTDEGLQGIHDLSGMEALQGSSMAAGAPTSPPSAEARPGAALGPEAKRGPAARTGPRAVPGAMAQAGLAPLSQPALGKAAASFGPSSSANASSSASAKAGAALGTLRSAGPDSMAPGAEGRHAPASKAAATSSHSTGDGFASIAVDTTANAPSASDALATPADTQAVGQWGQLEPEVGTPAWQQALSQQVMQMRRGNTNEAELQLNPLGLGPLRIKLSLREQALMAEFSAAHAQVREALEAALPQLREALQQGGIQLGQAVVEAGGLGGQGEPSLAGSGFTGSGNPGQDSLSGRPGAAQAPKAIKNQAVDALATQAPRQGPGQRLNTFA